MEPILQDSLARSGEATVSNSPPSPDRRPRALIDADVHQSIADYTRLRPYLPPPGAPTSRAASAVLHRIRRCAGGLYRTDVTPPGEGEPGAIRTGCASSTSTATASATPSSTGQHLGLGTLPDGDFATALASAYNSWTVTPGSPSTTRTDGSRPPSWSPPRTATPREIDRLGAHPLRAGADDQRPGGPHGAQAVPPHLRGRPAPGPPVAVHPGSEGRGVAGPPTAAGWVSKHIEWHTCLPQTAQAHVVSLVCQGVFVKYPRLKVVLVECGMGWLPHVMWRLDKNYKALRNEVPWLERLPSEYIKAHIRLTTQPVEEPESDAQFLSLLEMMDAGQTLMLSTDYPHWDFDDPVAAFRSVPQPLRQRIFHDTIRRALRAVKFTTMDQATAGTAPSLPERRTRHVVARVEDLPAGQRKIVRVGQREIGVFHTTAGLFALRNVCPHQGAPCAWGPSPGPPSPPPPGSTSGAWRGGPALPLARLGVQSETGVGLYDPYRHERVATYEVRVEGDEVVLLA